MLDELRGAWDHVLCTNVKSKALPLSLPSSLPPSPIDVIKGYILVHVVSPSGVLRTIASLSFFKRIFELFDTLPCNY